MNWYKKSIKESEKPDDKVYYMGSWPKIQVDDSAIKDYVNKMEEKWIPVDSSFITHVAYYEPLKIFEVKMKDGRQYMFDGVPKKTFNTFMKAKSKGEFFNKIIKAKYSPRQKQNII